jgi:hypothetical protein
MLGHEDPVHPRQLDEPRVRDVLGKVASMIRRDEPVAAPVEDESRAVNEGQDVPDVGREEIAKLGRSVRGCTAIAPRPDVPVSLCPM